MDFNWKVLIFVLVLGVLVWLNYKFKNIVVKGYNFFSQFPKLILVGIGIMIVVSPFLLKDNSLLNAFRDFLPNSINEKLDVINGIKNNNPQNFQPYQNQNRRITGTTRDRRKVPEQLKKVVAANQKWKCRHCNNDLDAKYEVDHIIALEDNGDNMINNLQALCRNCHGKKTLSDDIKRKYPEGRL
jgi:5-methylcytosine-specific restriction endonuclease McrA